MGMSKVMFGPVIVKWSNSYTVCVYFGFENLCVFILCRYLF